MSAPEDIEALRYLPDGSFHTEPAYLTDLEVQAMNMSLELANTAMEGGNPPVGAVLFDKHGEGVWGGITTDQTGQNLTAHAEMQAYELAQPTVGADLSECVLVTTSQPCTSCTPPYVEGKIGKIIYAASREEVWPITGIMRPRAINLHELLVDGNTDTVVVGGYRAAEALAKFTTWAEMNDQPLATMER